VGQRVGVGEALVLFELRLDAFEFGGLVAERARHLPAMVDRRIGGRRHRADDLLQQVLGQQAAVAEAARRLVEDPAIFLDVAALASEQRGDVLEFPGDDVARMLDDTGPVMLGKEGASDEVEIVLRRPVAQGYDGKAEFMVAAAQRFVENLVVARQAKHAELAHGRHNRAGNVCVPVGRGGCGLHILFTLPL